MIASVFAAAASVPQPVVSLWEAVFLGVVEGLTEFLPVSSTGHLILIGRLLGLRGPAVDAYSVVIQLGALLAAVVYYRRVFVDLVRGVLGRDAESLRLLRSLIVASLPVLALGYLFGKQIKARLFQPSTVVLALLFGGLLMLAVEWLHARRPPPQQQTASQLSLAGALITGLVQALSLWPGTSRSMACIVGAQLSGLPRAAAADFAFLLALPTLGTATLYELLKHGRELSTSVGIPQLVLGLLVSFVVGWLVIAGFLRYLRRFGMWPFAVYRIALAALLLCLL